MFKELWEYINPSRKVKDHDSIVQADFEGLFVVFNLWIDWFISYHIPIYGLTDLFPVTFHSICLR